MVLEIAQRSSRPAPSLAEINPTRMALRANPAQRACAQKSWRVTMRLKHLSLLASASLCGILIQAGLLPTSAHAQSAHRARCPRPQEGNDGRRAGQRQEGWQHHHHHGGHRRQGPATASRPSGSRPASTRSRSARSATTWSARRPPRCRPAAPPRPTSSSARRATSPPAFQRRMAQQHARQRPAEGSS